MHRLLRISFIGSLSALGVATCCLLPMLFLLAGLGGSWLAVFGKIAALSYPVLIASTLLVALSWGISLRRGRVARMRAWLVASTVLTGLAWTMVTNEGRINDALMGWM